MSGDSNDDSDSQPDPKKEEPVRRPRRDGRKGESNRDTETSPGEGHRHRSRSHDRSDDRHHRGRSHSHDKYDSDSSNKKRHHRSRSHDAHDADRKHRSQDISDLDEAKVEATQLITRIGDIKAGVETEALRKKEEIARLQKEMEEQQKEMEKNNRKLRDDIQKQRNRSKMFYVMGFCLVVCAIIGVALVFALRNNDEDAATAVVDTTTVPATLEPSNSPTVSLMPSTDPSSLPSVYPSPAPTVFDSLYDPPSLEDCEAIVSGVSVAGQDNMILKDLQINLDITVTAPSITADDLQQPLQDKIDDTLIPEMVGCNTTLTARFLKNSPLRGQRRLQTAKELRYIFGNAIGT
ncbi:MAG: hypothetical protein SGBAC_011132, partial [Bacillariaceae sp.]